MASEMAIRTANNLYEMRRAAKTFFGPYFNRHFEQMKGILERVQVEQKKTSVLDAAYWLAKRVDQSDLREMALIFGTAVEMLEPSESKLDSLTGADRVADEYWIKNPLRDNDGYNPDEDDSAKSETRSRKTKE
jgi:hypothetical protein